MKRLALGILAIVAVCAAYAPICNFETSTYKFANYCEDDDCGIGCTVVSTGPNQRICSTHGSTCCMCLYYTIQCDCLLGSGTGLEAFKYNMANSLCNSSTGYCYVIQ